MSPGRILFALFALGLAIVFGASMVDNLRDDNIFKLTEVLGIVILAFVFFGGFAVVFLFGSSDAICAVMERRGDQLRWKGDLRGARVWYDRCLWLQDHLLNNTWRRAQIAGKHVATTPCPDDENGEIEDPMQSANSLDEGVFAEPKKFVIPPAVSGSFLYKYVFAILFGLVSAVHALDGSPTSAVVILFVGAILNAYWLNTMKDP